MCYFLNDKENIAADLRKEITCWRWHSLTADSGIRLRNFTNGSFKRKSEQYRMLNSFNLHFDRHAKKIMVLYIAISCPLRSKGESQAAIISSHTHSSSVWHRSRWYACIMHNCLPFFISPCTLPPHVSLFHLFNHFLTFPSSSDGPLLPSHSASEGRFDACQVCILDGAQGKEVMVEICL